MFALRVPFAAGSGVLLALAVFLGLWQLVDVPFAAGTVIPAVNVEYTRTRPDTPTETTRKEKPKRKPTTVVPEHRLIIDEFGSDPTTIRPTATLVVAPTRTKLLSVGADRDITPLVRIEPDYPPTAITRGLEGWVLVQFDVTANGSVSNAVVVNSEPGSVFDDAALKAVQRWRYNPRIDNGVAVNRVGLQTVLRFELKN